MDICRHFDDQGSVRIVKVRTEYQLCICIAYQIWGAAKLSLSTWQPGDRVLFEVESEEGVSEFSALATVTGRSFKHNPSLIWDHDEFPYRIPLVFEVYIPPTEREECTRELKALLRKEVGYSWGLNVLSQSPLPGDVGNDAVSIIREYPNLVDLLQKRIGAMLSVTWSRAHDDEKESVNPHGSDVEGILNPGWREEFINPNPVCPACHSRNTRSIYYGTVDAPRRAPEQGYSKWGVSCYVGEPFRCHSCGHRW